MQTRIIGGTPEPGQPSVVYIRHDAGGGYYGGCTGTVIGPRVVLTAKHCVVNMDSYGNSTGLVPASSLGIYVGQTPNLYSPPKYTVSEARTTPGSQITDNDIAVIIVNGVMSEAPYPVLSTLPSGFINSQVQLIGYGVSVCATDGPSGTKLRTTDTVVGYEGTNSFVSQGKGANSGDSGGPVFNMNYEVVGVMVAVPQDNYGNIQCGYTICTRIDRYQSLIQQALEDTGGCYPTGPEVCGDGVDNDCDGQVDDGCNPAGAPCASNDDCGSGVCLDLGSGLVCAQTCDPLFPGSGCGAGYYCRESGCGAGVCAPGSPGSAEVGARCTQDTDCGSLYCKAGADGFSYCAVHCTLDQGDCLPHEVCAQVDGTCGACLPSTAYQGQRGIGEICQLGANCRSALCIEDAGAYYCSQSCASAADCPDGFHCRGDRCIRGNAGDAGAPCVLSADCLPGLTCYTGDAAPYCTQQSCDTAGCPAGMVCTPVGASSICTMTTAPTGSRCDAAADCFSAGCIEFSDDSSCSLGCGRTEPCPTGTFCTLSDSGLMACAPNSLPPVIIVPGGGGAKKTGCQAAGDAPTPLWPLLLGLALFALRRRRR